MTRAAVFCRYQPPGRPRTKVTKLASGRRGFPRPPYALVSAITVTVLGAAAALGPPRMLMFGWVALGPALAAASGSPSVVLAVSGVALLVTGVVLRSRPGAAVADQLRGRNPGLRVLYLSGNGEDELRRRCELDEACRLVRKPSTAVELLAAVEEVFRRATARPSRYPAERVSS